MAVLVQSTTLKLVGIAVLALLFVIPLALVDGLVRERQGRQLEAEAGIARSQGRAQVLSPPLLEWRVRRVVQGEKGPVESIERHALAPALAELDSTIGVERRRRGIFEVPVYTATISLRGSFHPLAEDLPGNGILEGLRLVLPIADLRGVRAIPRVRVAGRELELTSLGGRVFDGEGLAAALPAEQLAPGALPFEIEIVLSGTREISVWPLAGETRVRLAGAWPAPSFGGAFLPLERSVDAQGFEARWNVLAVNRDLPRRWIGDGPDGSALEAARFGVELYEPVGVYRLNERSLKYGLLFVALTFGVFFLAEVTGSVRVHPVQYLLVGAALAVFYLVLLALSEHLGFGPAYALAAAALTMIVGGYGASAFGSRPRGLGVAAWLATLYGFLFLMVRSEDYALLTGALGLLGMLAASLYLTRHIDWYAPRNPPPPLPTG
jgi:inner membrane protein